MSRLRVDHDDLAPRLHKGSLPLLGLQTMAGNRAVSQALAVRALQRCGPGSSCDCQPEERAAKEAAMGLAVQRETKEPTTPAVDAEGEGSVAGPQPFFGPALQVPEEQAKSFINECCEVLGGVATRAPRWPDARDSVQAMPVQAMLQRAIAVQRAGGGSSANVEFGVVGSVQACYDFCTGDLDFNGWIWAGIGSHLPVVGWVGPYYFKEGHLGRINIGNLLSCGTCADNCAPAHGASDGGWGIAGFPVHLTPGQWARFKKAGVEFGVLVTPHSLCDADLEAIVLLNLIGYLGPVGAAITRFVDGINQAGARFGVNVMLEFGLQANGGGHLCKSARGGVTADHVSLCGGGYVGGGIGLSRDKTTLPH